MLDETATLYGGAGTTFPVWGALPVGIRVEVIERTRLGNWVLIRLPEGMTSVNEGWVFTAALDETFTLSEVRINDQTPQVFASAPEVAEPALAQLYSAPILPTPAAHLLEVYALGQTLGNASNAISKIGDSLTVDPIYLTPISRDDNILGPYTHLAEAIGYYGASMRNDSAAAWVGLSTRALFDPMWANPRVCEAGESALMCEYRRQKPSIAYIMFGPNELNVMDAAEFETNMQQIVEESLAAGVIPVLSTFSYRPEYLRGAKAIQFNLIVLRVGETYDVPVMNLWAAARDLPRSGLDPDQIHMRHYGSVNLRFDGTEGWSGVSLRNLLSVSMLAELYTFLH
jgi:hypothetical protein